MAFARNATRYEIPAYFAVSVGLSKQSTVKVDSGRPDPEKLQMHWKSRAASSEGRKLGGLPICSHFEKENK